MHAHEQHALYLAVKVRVGVRVAYHVYILRPYHNVNVLVFHKAAVHALKVPAHEVNEQILFHYAGQYVAFAYEFGNEHVLGFVINIRGRAYLLYLAFVHYNDGVAHGERLLLIVRNENERYAKALLHFFKLYLHALAQLQIKRAERFVKQQNLRLVYQRARDCNALLLSAGKP